MAASTILSPLPLLLRPMPFRKYRPTKTLDLEKVKTIFDIGNLQERLQENHKDVSNRNDRLPTQTQQVHNSRTKVIPLNINIGDFVTVRVGAKRIHKLENKWKGHIGVVETKSVLIFVIEDVNTSDRITAHAQCLVSYPINFQDHQTLKERKQQALYYDMNAQFVEEIAGARKKI